MTVLPYCIVVSLRVSYIRLFVTRIDNDVVRPENLSVVCKGRQRRFIQIFLAVTGGVILTSAADQASPASFPLRSII